MAMMRWLILLLMLVLGSTGNSLIALGADDSAVALGQIRATGDDSREWEEHQSQLPLATLQEAAPTGQISIRPQRVVPGQVNVLSRGGGKSSASLTYKNLDKARWSCGARQESAPFSISVSSDYYVIALRHIIR